ncbi:calcitonin gene-related peptide 2 [Electrophorus electricus]|nr:calcitonin gene-related peptide 2 [Electrophorus electricus]
MDHLTVSVLLFLLPALLLPCAAPPPSNRYIISSNEQADDSPEEEGWMVPGLSTSPFLRFTGSQPQRALATVSSHQHHIEKRKCNTATCVTQRLADFLIRSSNAIGTVYAPTNVGSSTYGKRDLLQMPNSLLL